MAKGSSETVLGDVEPLRLRTGVAEVEPLLAAVAVAWTMGLSPDLMVAGLKTFEPALELAHVA